MAIVNKVIIYDNLIHAEALCHRLSGYKSQGDKHYSSTTSNHNSTLWAVQVLKQHENVLSKKEREKLQDLPDDFFGDLSI